MYKPGEHRYFGLDADDLDEVLGVCGLFVIFIIILVAWRLYNTYRLDDIMVKGEEYKDIDEKLEPHLGHREDLKD